MHTAQAKWYVLKKSKYLLEYRVNSIIKLFVSNIKIHPLSQSFLKEWMYFYILLGCVRY